MGVYIRFCLLTGAVLFSSIVTAQVQFSAAGSILKGSGYYDNHSVLLGGGASMKYVFKDRFLIGITGRAYQANTTAYPLFNASTKEQNLAGTLEVIFNKQKKFKSYLGADAGVSATSHMINYIRISNNYFVGSLRGGAYYNFGQSTGLYWQLQYNYMGDTGKYDDVPGVVNPVLTEPIQKYWTIDVGLFIRLYVK
jgi:hypothetical protein